MRKEFAKVPRQLLPMGGKGPVPFAPLMANMVPPVMLHQIAIVGAGKGESEGECDPDVPVFGTGMKGKRQGAPPPPRPPLCVNQGQTRLGQTRLGLTLMPLCRLQG